MNTWEFDTTIGAGSEVVTVVYEYEQDLDSTKEKRILGLAQSKPQGLGLLREIFFGSGQNRQKEGKPLADYQQNQMGGLS